MSKWKASKSSYNFIKQYLTFTIKWTCLVFYHIQLHDTDRHWTSLHSFYLAPDNTEKFLPLLFRINSFLGCRIVYLSTQDRYPDWILVLVLFVLKLSVWKLSGWLKKSLEVQIDQEKSRFNAVKCFRYNYLNKCDLHRLNEEKCLYKKCAGGDLGILPERCQALELTYNFSQTQPWQKAITGSGGQMLISLTVKWVNGLGNPTHLS